MRKNYFLLSILFLSMEFVLFQVRAENEPTKAMEYLQSHSGGNHLSTMQSLSTQEVTVTPIVGSVEDSLRGLPELQVLGGELNTYTPGVFIRGANSEHALVIWNGILLNDSTSPGAGADLHLYQREFSHKVKVYKGPQSLLYGPSAIGGVIVLERDPSRNSRLQFLVGRYQTHKESLEWQHLREHEHIYLGFQNLESEGTNALLNTTTQERDSLRRQSATVISDYQLLRGGTASGIISYYQLKNDEDTPPLDDPSAYHTLSSLDSGVFSEQVFEGGDRRHKWELTYSHRERENINQTDFIDDAWYRDRAKIGQLNFKFLEISNVEYGTLHWGSDFKQEQLLSSSAGSYQLPIEWTENQQQFGLVALLEKRWSSLILSGGIREQFLPGTQENVGVYQFMGQWLFNGVSPFVIVSSGFKPPSLYQKFSRSGERQLKSELSRSYEVGVQANWNQIYLQASGFFNHFDHLIDYNLSKEKYENISSAETSGVEVNSVVNFGKFSNTLGASWILAKNLQTGQYLLRRPMQRASWGVGWNNSNYEWKVDQYFVGEREDQWNSRRIVLPSYLLTHLNFIYKKWGPELVFKIQNLFNISYVEIAGYQTLGPSLFVGVNYFL